MIKCVVDQALFFPVSSFSIQRYSSIYDFRKVHFDKISSTSRVFRKEEYVFSAFVQHSFSRKSILRSWNFVFHWHRNTYVIDAWILLLWIKTASFFTGKCSLLHFKWPICCDDCYFLALLNWIFWWFTVIIWLIRLYFIFRFRIPLDVAVLVSVGGILNFTQFFLLIKFLELQG